MKQAAWLWYLLAAVAVLAPAGLRALTWQRPKALPVDTSMAQAGQDLFKHEWTKDDKLAGGDGLGPVFNATSCQACHFQNGVGGSGGLSENVTVFTIRPTDPDLPVREGVVHAMALPGYQETLAQVAPGLPEVSKLPLDQLVRITRPGHCVQAMSFPQGVHISQRNTPALWGAKLIDEIPERDIIANERRQKLAWAGAPADGEDAPVGRALRLGDGRIGRFGWKAQSPSLAAFVQAACANELGLGNPGQAQPRPLGRPEYQPSSTDLTQEQCDQLTAFCASLARPVERVPPEIKAEDADKGKKLFRNIGCADCHTPNLGGVEGLYSDLLLHRMGQDLEGGGSYNDPPKPPPQKPNNPPPNNPPGPPPSSYNDPPKPPPQKPNNPPPNNPPGPPPSESPSPGEWRTPPLWGVADSGPYLHDGRAPTLEDAIRLHGGQAGRSSRRFAALPANEQAQLVSFLRTLKAP
jgi:CxxC motif-containing protein (DUF1111 family)